MYQMILKLLSYSRDIGGSFVKVDTLMPESPWRAFGQGESGTVVLMTSSRSSSALTGMKKSRAETRWATWTASKESTVAAQ